MKGTLMDLGLSARAAVVTGAGRGVGRRIALTLAEEGAAVVVNDLFPDRCEQVAAEIEAAGGRAVAAACDVTDYDAVGQMFEAARARFGSVNIVVNNAGVPPPRPQEAIGEVFHETKPDDWRRIMDVVTWGVMNTVHVALPGMIDQNYGKIVSIVSDAGIVGEPRAAAYAFAKAGVIGFSKSVAKEVGKYRINVNCVSPGATMVEEGQLDRRDRLIDTERQANFYSRVLKAYPMGQGWERAGVPTDVADAVAFLCSDRSVFVTGSVLRVSGGFSIA
jgi:NAD(P)-dependent dehydrogenase (short-subunit alcohol dehydrogenase family)